MAGIGSSLGALPPGQQAHASTPSADTSSPVTDGPDPTYPQLKQSQVQLLRVIGFTDAQLAPLVQQLTPEQIDQQLREIITNPEGFDTTLGHPAGTTRARLSQQFPDLVAPQAPVVARPSLQTSIPEQKPIAAQSAGTALETWANRIAWLTIGISVTALTMHMFGRRSNPAAVTAVVDAVRGSDEIARPVVAAVPDVPALNQALMPSRQPFSLQTITELRQHMSPELLAALRSLS